MTSQLRVDATRVRAGASTLYVAEVITGAGDGIFWVALVTRLADHPQFELLLTAAVIARLGPRALLSLPAGALLDRVNLRSLLVMSDLLRAALMLVLAIAVTVVDVAPIPILLAVMATYVVGVPSRPALSIAITKLVEEDDLASANATISSIRQAMTFIGPLIGVAIVAWSVPAAFAVNGLSFAMSAAMIGAIPTHRWPRTRKRTEKVPPNRRRRSWIVTELRPPVARQVPGLPSLIALIGIMYFVRGAEMVLHVLVVSELLGADASAIGYLGGAIGLGAVIAAPLARHLANSSGLVASIALAVALTALPTTALMWSSDVATACGLLVLVGVGVVVFEVVSVVAVQRTAPENVRGRIFGAVHGASNLGKLTGAVIMPAVVALVDVRGALLVVSILVTVAAALAVRPLRPLARRASGRRRELAPLVDVLAELEIFDGAPRYSLERIAQSVAVERVPAGAVLIRQGEPADAFFIVRDGTFDVAVDDRVVNSVASDEWLGEIGLVERRPRTATVTATSSATVWRIPAGDFLATLADLGAPPTALVAGIADRLARDGNGNADTR